MTDMAMGPAWRPDQDRRAYVWWIGVIWAAVIAGFALDIGRYLSETPAPPLILHLHGAVGTLWLGVFTAQIALVETRNVALHRRLGWWLACLSVLMIPMGFLASMVDQARQVTHPDYAPQFLGLEFGDLIVFSILVGAALLLRRRLAAHKRLMVLAAALSSDVGWGRISSNGYALPIPGMLGWWSQYYGGIALIIVAMMAWDLLKWRRVHPALLSGAALV